MGRASNRKKNPIFTMKRESLEAIAHQFSLWTKTLAMSGNQLITDIEQSDAPDVEQLESFKKLKDEIDEILDYVESSKKVREEEPKS